MKKIYTVEVYRSREDKNGFDHCRYIGDNLDKAKEVFEIQDDEENEELNSVGYKNGDYSNIIMTTYEVPNDFDIEKDQESLGEYQVYEKFETIKKGD